MTPVIDPRWFYLMDVNEKFRQFVFVLMVTTIVWSFVRCIYDSKDDDISSVSDDFKNLKVSKWQIIVMIFCLVFLIFGPTSETIVKMLIADNITYESLDAGEEVVKGTVDYIIDRLNENSNQ